MLTIWNKNCKHIFTFFVWNKYIAFFLKKTEYYGPRGKNNSFALIL